MTVAIACTFQHGVLFCADTQLTTHEEKAHGSKMYAQQWGDDFNALTVFTFAGVASYAGAAIEKCERAVAKLDFAHTSLDEMQDTVEAALVNFYKIHVFPYPDQADVAFQLLIGLWLNGEARTLSTTNTTLRPVHAYECVGSGGYIARYWLRELLGPPDKFESDKLTLEEASLIIDHAVNSAAEYDESCGGEIEFIGMRNNGEINEVGDIRAGTYLSDFPAKLRSECWVLLRQMVKCQDTDEQEIAVEQFCEAVRSLHKPVAGLLKEFERIKESRNAAFSGEDS